MEVSCRMEMKKTMEQKETNNYESVHRTGTITCGITLILFGILFLVHMVFPALNYRIIFRLWPCILIALGVEVLVANAKPDQKFVYDKGAIVLLMILVIFAMIMAGIDLMFTYGATCISFS